MALPREKEYSCNLEGFEGKVNIFMGIKGNVRSLLLSLLINSLKFSSRGRRPVWSNHVKSSYYFSICLGIATLLVFFCKYYILPQFRNVNHGLERTTFDVIGRLLVWSQYNALDLSLLDMVSLLDCPIST